MSIPQEKYTDFLETLLLSENLQILNNKIDEFIKSPIVKENNIKSKDILRDFELILKHKIKEDLNVKDGKPSDLIQSVIDTYLKRFFPEKRSRNKFIESCLFEDLKPSVIDTKSIIQKAQEKRKKNNYIIKGILPESAFILLSAPPKKGKSSWIVDLISCVALGKKWANRDVVKYKTLIVQNDMGEDQSCLHIYKNQLMLAELEHRELFDAAISENSLIMMKDVDIVMDIDWLFNYAVENNIQLIIIDALVSSLRKSGLNEFSNEITPNLYRIHELAHMYNKCVILLHHDNKGALSKDYNPNNVDDLMRTVSGVSGITRTTDGFINLSSNKENSDVINVNINMARYYGIVALTMRYVEGEANHWYWEVIDDKSFDDKTINLICDILELLYERWEEWKDAVLDIQELSDNGKSIPEEYKGLYNNVYGYTLDEFDNLLDKYDRKTIMKQLSWLLPDKYGAIVDYVDKTINKRVYCIPASGECSLKSYVDERREKIRNIEMQKEADDLAKEKLKEILNNYPNTNLKLKGKNLALFKKEFGEDLESWNRVKSLLKQDDELLYQHLLIALSYFVEKLPTPYNLGSKVKFVNNDNDIYEVIDLNWDFAPNPVQNERVLYSLKNIENDDELPNKYRNFQLELIEDNNEDNNSSESNQE